jgi:hypothetical protein
MGFFVKIQLNRNPSAQVYYVLFFKSEFNNSEFNYRNSYTSTQTKDWMKYCIKTWGFLQRFPNYIIQQLSE